MFFNLIYRKCTSQWDNICYIHIVYQYSRSILNLYIENDNNVNEIISKGHDKNTVKDIIKLVDKNEYKRRQSAPGIKVTSKNFGRDRRMPIANNYTKFIFNNIHKGNK